jgi:uncharacterized protein
MYDRLPKYIDPLHLVDKRGVIKGKLPLDRFGRLAEILQDNSGFVSLELSFGRNGSLAVIEGKIETELQLICQNCLQSVTWPVDSPVKLVVVRSLDEVSRIPEDYEPLLHGEENLLLSDIVEDELLLILPQFPKHSYQCLEQSENLNNNHSEPEQTQSNPDNPFAILTSLKNTGDS